MFFTVSMSIKNKRMQISVYTFYLTVLKIIGNHCHVLFTKVISEKKISTAARRTTQYSKRRQEDWYLSLWGHFTSNKPLPQHLQLTMPSEVALSSLLAFVVVCHQQPKIQLSYWKKIKFGTQNYIFYTLHGFAYCLVHSNGSMYRYKSIKVSRK